MSKEKKVEVVKEMIRVLSFENEIGGFNEAGQFCEDWFEKVIPYLPVKVLNEIIDDIESASRIGLTRRNYKKKFEEIRNR